MENYLEKCLKLHNEGLSTKDIIENLYLNYSSLNDNDLIFKYKKILSKEFNVSLKDIRLIGSFHTNFSKNKETNYIIKKDKIEDINDFDFAIINTSLFIEYWTKVNLNPNYELSNPNFFYSNLNNGKFHPKLLYKNGSIYNEIQAKVKKTNSDKSLTICIYAFENAFINNLCFYFEQALSDYFRELKAEKLDNELFNGIVIKPLKKMETN